MGLIYMEKACLFKVNPQRSFHCNPKEDIQGHAVEHYEISLQYKILFCCMCHLICVTLAPSSTTVTEAKSVFDTFVDESLSKSVVPSHFQSELNKLYNNKKIVGP